MFKFRKLRQKIKEIKKGKQSGMTYVEIIVVLSIFAVMSSIVIFNYGSFQDKIDMKNLADDIATKIVEAQKSAMSGKIPLEVPAMYGSNNLWKPSYGVYFDTAKSTNFIYFADLFSPDGVTQNGSYDGDVDSNNNCEGDTECLDRIDITKGNKISSLIVHYSNTTDSMPLSDLSISFKRPNSDAIISSTDSLAPGISYAQITVTSPKGTSTIIQIYPTGRIEVK